MEPNQSRAAIEQQHRQFVEAFRSNDEQALGALYTENAVLLPPARATVNGRASIVAFWKGAERIQDLRFEPTDVQLLGPTVMREAGTLHITTRGQGREQRVNEAKYVSVWLNVEGAWKLDSSIWNGATGGRQGRRGQGGGGQAGGGQGGGYGQGRGRQGGGGQRGGGQGGRGRQGGGQGGGGYGQGGGRGRRGGGGQGGGGQGGGGQGGGGYGQGGRGQGGGGQGGGYGQGGGGQGGGGQGGGGYGQGGGGGGFGPRSERQRANRNAPMVPRTE